MTDIFHQAKHFYFEGNRLLARNDLQAASQYYQTALALYPTLAEALANLAYIAEQSGKFNEAETHYLRALELLPDNIQIYVNLSAFYLNQRRLDEAENLLLAALRISTQSAAVWTNWGVLHACKQNDDLAESAYRIALSINPDSVKAQFNLSYVLLRHGRMKEAWPYYEAREQIQHLKRFFTCPAWQGESLQGKSIIVGFEAGHGDMIQFCRYVPLLKQLGAREVTLVCHPGLFRLFGSLQGVDRLYSIDDEVSPDRWDFWIAMMSLPMRFQTTLENIPNQIPYLTVQASLIERWRSMIERCGNGRKVGLVWQGNQRFESDKERSLASLECFSLLSSVSEIAWVSLQKGAGEMQVNRPPEGMSVLAIYDLIQDFADTAAAIMHLDLVITVDTAVAHLAGSLGKPCWLLLRHYRPDWRWLVNRNDSPWYPSMRLFRQGVDENWSSVLEQVKDGLIEWKVAQNQRDHC